MKITKSKNGVYFIRINNNSPQLVSRLPYDRLRKIADRFPNNTPGRTKKIKQAI